MTSYICPTNLPLNVGTKLHGHQAVEKDRVPLCSCGAAGHAGLSAARRLQWHRDHKRSVVEAGVDDLVHDLILRQLDSKGVPARGCLLWTGSRNASGYGIVSFHLPGGTLFRGYAHRLAYEVQAGRIPTGHHIDHLCRVRACYRIEHLEAVPPGENTRRSMSPSSVFGRGRCHRGHDVRDPAQVYISPDGRRFCRTCQRIRARDRWSNR